MPSTPTPSSPRSPDLRRRLRARERRVHVLRRRVSAVAVTLFLLSWAGVYEGGAFGHSTAVTLVAATKSASTHDSRRSVSSGSSSSAAKSTSAASTTSDEAASQSTTTATPVTTQQS